MRETHDSAVSESRLSNLPLRDLVRERAEMFRWRRVCVGKVVLGFNRCSVVLVKGKSSDCFEKSSVPRLPPDTPLHLGAPWSGSGRVNF